MKKSRKNSSFLERFSLVDFKIAIPMQILMFDSDSGAELHEESNGIIAVAIRAQV